MTATATTNHTTICWACAEKLPPRATRCQACGELQATNPQTDVMSWTDERLTLRLGGHVPSEGCCVGCGRANAGVVRRRLAHVPTGEALVWLPLLVTLPILCLVLLALREQKTTIGVRICWRCRSRELGTNLALTISTIFLLGALPLLGIAIGDKLVRTPTGVMVGGIVGFMLWAAAAVVAKAMLSPRATAVRLHGMDDRSVQLSFRCPRAIRA